MRVCATCGQPLPRGKRPEAKYCSRRCLDAAKRRSAAGKARAGRERQRHRAASEVRFRDRKCEVCGKPTPAYQRPGYVARARYCSSRCLDRAFQRRRRERLRVNRVCLFCGASLAGYRLTARFCSVRCKNGHHAPLRGPRLYRRRRTPQQQLRANAKARERYATDVEFRNDVLARKALAAGFGRAMS